jgi:hypothetical protein
LRDFLFSKKTSIIACLSENTPENYVNIKHALQARKSRAPHRTICVRECACDQGLGWLFITPHYMDTPSEYKEYHHGLTLPALWGPATVRKTEGTISYYGTWVPAHACGEHGLLHWLGQFDSSTKIFSGTFWASEYGGVIHFTIPTTAGVEKVETRNVGAYEGDQKFSFQLAGVITGSIDFSGTTHCQS